MSKLRTTVEKSISIPTLYNLPQNVSSVIFQNCRSFKRHFTNIRNEKNMLAANTLAFAETCLRPTDRSTDYQLFIFDLYPIDDFCCRERPYHGTVVYSTFFKVENIFNVELTYGYIFHENSRINIGFVYCPPKIASFGLFKKVFANLHNKYDLKQPQVIMRDFNFNVHHVKSFPTYLSLDILCVNL